MSVRAWILEARQSSEAVVGIVAGTLLWSALRWRAALADALLLPVRHDGYDASAELDQVLRARAGTTVILRRDGDGRVVAMLLGGPGRLRGSGDSVQTAVADLVERATAEGRRS